MYKCEQRKATTFYPTNGTLCRHCLRSHHYVVFSVDWVLPYWCFPAVHCCFYVVVMSFCHTGPRASDPLTSGISKSAIVAQGLFCLQWGCSHTFCYGHGVGDVEYLGKLGWQCDICKKKKKSLFLQEAVFYAKMAFFFFFCSVVLLMGVEYFLWILASAGLWCSVASTEKDLVVH